MEEELRINIADWIEEFTKEEPTLNGDDDLVDLVIKHGTSTAKAGRLAVAARHLGIAPAMILHSNKMLLMSGARGQVSSLVTRRKRSVKVEGRKEELVVKEFVGKTSSQESDDNTQASAPKSKQRTAKDKPVFVESLSDDGVERAKRYLFDVVPGHIYNRLKILYAAGEDMHDIELLLKAMIEDLIIRLEVDGE